MRGNLVHLKVAFSGYGIELRPVTPLDLPALRRWRNCPSIRKQMHDKSYITPEQQRRWFESISTRPDQVHWVIWFNRVRTGYVNIRAHVRDERAQRFGGGYYLADTAVRQPLLGLSTVMMYHDIIFGHADGREIKDTIMKTNFSARGLNRLMGYREYGETSDVICISLLRDDYFRARQRFLRYFTNTQCLPIS